MKKPAKVTIEVETNNPNELLLAFAEELRRAAKQKPRQAAKKGK